MMGIASRFESTVHADVEEPDGRAVVALPPWQGTLQIWRLPVIHLIGSIAGAFLGPACHEACSRSLGYGKTI
jgi:hypothetical protein